MPPRPGALGGTAPIAPARRPGLSRLHPAARSPHDDDHHHLRHLPSRGAAPEAGRTCGETLATLVEEAATGVAGVATRRHACLMGCTGACTVAVQARGKMCYTLGRFEPSPEAAAAIVAWAARHAELPAGIVPYREWPEAIRGHFVTRHPPLTD